MTETFSTIAHNATEAAYPHLRQGLVGAWVPALGVTGGTLRDASGRKHHGTLTNMDPATKWQNSGGSWSLEFRYNEYVLLPPRSIELPFSLSVWFRSENLTKSFQSLFTGNTNTATQTIYCGVHYSSGSSRMVFYADGAYAADSDAFTQDSSWHHYAWAVQFGGAGQYFRDGVQIGTFSRNVTPKTPSAGSIGLIKAVLASGFFTQGDISECSRWARALTAAEIKTLYQSGPGGWLARKRRRVYSIPATAFQAAWANRATTIAGVLR